MANPQTEIIPIETSNPAKVTLAEIAAAASEIKADAVDVLRQMIARVT